MNFSWRRGFLGMTDSGLLLSGAAVAILNAALGLEHEAIAAYQIGGETGLLDKGTLGIAVAFQGQHKARRDSLIATIGKLGGTDRGHQIL